MSFAVESNSTADELASAEARRIVLGDEPLVECLESLRVDEDAADICLDFRRIESVNSHELSALIRFSLRIRQLAKSIAICNVGPALGEIFEITRFGRWHRVIE